MTGDVLINGKKRSIHSRVVSYVTQEDVFLGTLSVRETLSYAAYLRLPSTITKHAIDEAIEYIINKMGLEDCANNKIGNWHLRGISNGEKRRLSIGVEMLTQPVILCLDEPTSGLDSVASFFVIQALQSIAHEGKIVICSIHQPSIDVFNLFDDLLLLSGGESVYFGEANMALKFFDDSGFPCPVKRNPPDHFLRCITTDFDRVFAILRQTHWNFDCPSSSGSSISTTTAEINAKLIENYKSSTYALNAKEKVQEVILLNDEYFSDTNIVSTGWWKQLGTLTRRSALNMSRDLGFYWLRLAFYIIISIGAGTLEFNIGTSNESILERAKCDGILYGIVICLSSGGLPFIMEELKVSNKEILGGHYGETAYILSNFFSSFPFILAMSFLSGALVYCTVNFHQLRFSQLIYSTINLWGHISVSESCLLFVAALAPNPLIAMGIAVGFLVLCFVASPILTRLSDLPKIFWRYPMSYISSVSWGIQGQLKNDVVGFEFDSPTPGQPKQKGEVILETMYGINPDRSKWRDVAALFCLFLAYRLLCFIALKYRQRLASSMHGFYTRRILSSQLFQLGRS